MVVQSPLEIAFFPSPPLPSSCTRDESARVVQRQRLLIAAKHYSKADNVGRPTVTRRISVGWIVGFRPRDIKSVANQRIIPTSGIMRAILMKIFTYKKFPLKLK